MEGPNGRWKTEDGELTRIRRRARGESPLGCRSGRSAEDPIDPAAGLSAPAGQSTSGAGKSLLRLANACLRSGIAPVAGESPAQRGIRLARPTSRSLGGAFGRSASGAVCSAVRPPAPATARRLLRSNRSLRESYAGFGGPRAGSHARLLSSESKKPAKESGHQLPEPECRLRRSTRPLGARSVGSGARFRRPSLARPT